MTNSGVEYFSSEFFNFLFSVERAGIVEIANFVACLAAWREITHLKGVVTSPSPVYVRFRAEGGPTLSATRYQFGQLNDPHLQGTKRVICSVISAAAASSSYRASLLPSRHDFTPAEILGDGVTTPYLSTSWNLVTRTRTVGAVFSYRRHCDFPRRHFCGIPEDTLRVEWDLKTFPQISFGDTCA